MLFGFEGIDFISLSPFFLIVRTNGLCDVRDLAINGRDVRINFGNPLFDALVSVVLDGFREEMLKGTVLVSPEDSRPYFAFFIRNRIEDNRATSQGTSNIASEILSLVCQRGDGSFVETSPAKLLDLCPPTSFAKTITPPDVIDEDDVVEWAYENETEPLLEKTQKTVTEDTENRRKYLNDAFTQTIMDIQNTINELQGKSLTSDDEKVQQKLLAKELRYNALKKRKQERMQELEHAVELNAVEPEVLGCAYVVPLSQVEYQQHYGMSRDDEVEAIAMKVAMNFERSEGRKPDDVSAENVGYDVRSMDTEGQKRYIEVKGRTMTDGVMLSENEKNRLAQLGRRAWLYIVTNCKSKPQLHIINDPANRMSFEQKTTGIQFYLPLQEWQARIEADKSANGGEIKG